ncbi:hypothetical protein QBC46DRAFT_253158 [Diplogelasinospora grovesii]|uniref:Pre-mRNA-splicing factor 38B n=1 Tax=Diplogelasinospora grovesii TaxID=303347 RepID=A0AAN6S841_9PEZI|nr:hypothetical protein QBC46DRAFT_253158 [Diplogelasinospora grovesii]
MPSDRILTDDYVAELLAKEASDASIRYSSMGLEAFRSAKPTSKAKPNTHFLGRIIKETTSHNAALLAKGAADAQARLEDLTDGESKSRCNPKHSARDLRLRQLGDISSILSGRRKKEPTSRATDTAKTRDGESTGKGQQKSEHGRPKRRRSEDDEAELTRVRRRDRPHRDLEGRLSRHERRVAERSRSPAHRHRSYRQRSPADDGDELDQDSSRDRRRNRTSDRLDSTQRSQLLERRRVHGHGRQARDGDSATSATRGEHFDQARSSTHVNSDRSVEEDDNASDPFEDCIGPAPRPQPSVRTRGRGAARGAAAMDSRFADGFDAQSDIPVESDAADGWDNAVEAYRDRQRWKQQGADRLRAAGFTEEQVRKWETGGEEDVDHVRWSKPGEQREWDRGKDA